MNFFFRLWDNVAECHKAAHATDGGIIQCILFECRVTNTKKLLSECVMLIAFSTAAMSTRTRHNFMLHVNLLS